ncbi:hypothetical protein IHE49_12985 [Rhodanobacter sp. 7MK24]|uniref:hypothetical protein n=1 Tax=Rhodanobacter sp. 7MK24 TaxID=2775922 RepID=UPI00178121FF|nr:hypothetical protein [Rhodanobacter sp. 7MK24]MBD8881396.1 hypothetical protein [Rhodanobacter sp. 7MK24]
MSVPPPLRSTFVTVLAWVFIGMAGFATLIAALQNLMLQWLFLPAMQAQPMPPLPQGMPVPMQWMFGHMAWFFRAFLLVSSLTLIAAIGLLRRHEWARRMFIGLMGFAIAYHLLGLAWQWWFMGSMDTFVHAPGMPADASAVMHGFMRAIQLFSTLMALGFCVLFGWIIRRLHSAQVRDEFRPWAASS